MSMRNEVFSRERLCGYDPDRLERSAVVVAGCGAAAANLVQTVALTGVGELRVVDFDHIEPSNLTRSPLYRRQRIAGKRRRYKAAECARSALELSMAKSPVARFAIARIEELGLGAFEGASVICAAVDSMQVRAYLADVARLLRIPLVEQGFHGARGQVTVWGPTASPSEAPCWRCVHPQVEHGSVGCALYARAAIEAGFAPATQPFAAVIANLAAAQALEAIHGRFPLDGRMLYVDVVRGASRIVEAVREPRCPGEHRALGPPRDVAVTASAPVDELFRAVAPFVREPTLHLRSPFVESASCGRCGAPVAVGAPAWRLAVPPLCRPACSEIPRLDVPGLATTARIEPGEPAAQRRLEALGYAARDLVELSDRATGASHVVRLGGSLTDLFDAAGEKNANVPDKARMERVGAPDAPKEK